jgi:valyl-tRNA synthetase
VVADLAALGLVARIEEREIELGHSDRSKTPVEPYLSPQWFVRMADVPGGVRCGTGERSFQAAGLAQAAIDVASGSWKTPSGRTVAFHPDGERYQRTYSAWLAEKRDWCISRQLWWGHQIPVWRAPLTGELLQRLEQHALHMAGEHLCVLVADEHGEPCDLDSTRSLLAATPARQLELQVCSRDLASDAAWEATLTDLGLVRDPDVLDTWFSSALWPLSTLGWPDPASAPIEPGQTPLGGELGADAFRYYYPGSCLVTGRDILTLWVARMVVMGLYLEAEVPFSDVFLHAKILDGRGETMSKSRGNGIDPLEICQRYGTDAMRYVICELQTGAQDVRLPVVAICPHTGTVVQLSEAERGCNDDGSPNLQIYRCPCCGQPFSVYGQLRDIPGARAVYSDRFEIGRAFCNKLWNAARFALINLGDALQFTPCTTETLALEDRWIRSRLAQAIASVDSQLAAYNPAAALSALRDFFWGDLCDWYLELIKPRLRDSARAPLARQVLAYTLDQTLRLLHPFVPFITEVIWEQLGRVAPQRGFTQAASAPELLIHAAWPQPQAGWHDAAVESDIALLQRAIRALRELRARYPEIKPQQPLPAALRCDEATAARLMPLREPLITLVRLSELTLGPTIVPPPHAAVTIDGELELHLGGLFDPVREREKLVKRRDDLLGLIAASERKLANTQFVAKAPAAVVASERDRQADLRTQLAQLEERLLTLA